MWKPHNVNDQCRVHLTHYGIEVYNHVYMDRGLPKIDAENCITVQFWTLVRAFGEHFRLGYPPPYDTISFFEAE